MIDSTVVTNVIIDSFYAVFDVFKPFLLAAIGIGIIKMLIGNVIEFLFYESSAKEIRSAKKSAFNFIDFISAISDLFPSKKDN